MSQTAITLAFEQWKASQAITGEPVLLDEFVFANVPGLDATKPVDRNEKLPPDAQIVHRQAVIRKGVVNENAMVHSVVLGADVGDFSFNWIGLINKASNTLAMIVHAPVQQKLKTKTASRETYLVWIGSGTINVAQLMLDTLDVVKELAEQTASHTHSNTGAPTNAGAIRNTGTKADTLNGKYSPVIGK